MVLNTTDQIRELQTMIRDKATSRSEFKFVADRLIRMVVEEGLNQLPYQVGCGRCRAEDEDLDHGCKYSGLKYEKGNCGVAIGRSGEAMEKALQDCCRSMRIGKILIDSDSDTETAHVVFAKFMEDIADRKVLLLYPIVSSGNKVCKAVEVLKEHQVPESHIVLINLFCTPKAAAKIVKENPKMTLLTTELHAVTPNHFGERYFGTDDFE